MTLRPSGIQLGVNIAAICIDSPVDGVFSGIHVCTQVLTYVPPFSFKEHDLMLC